MNLSPAPTRFRKLAGLSLVLLLPFPVHSQEPAPQPAVNAGPNVILAPPAAATAWTVNYTYEKSRERLMADSKNAIAARAIDPADLDRPKKIRFVVKHPLAEMSATYESGGKQQAYYFRNHEFGKPNDSDDIRVTDLESYPTVIQLFRTRFPGVHWVTPAHFVRVEDAHGESCSYFRDRASAAPSGEKMDLVIDSSKYQDREAWFSVSTGLPVAFKAGDATGKYAFEPPPATNISLPPTIRDKMNEIIRYQNYLEQRNAGEEGAPE